MDRKIVEQVVEEARQDAANLVIWDHRDTFTVESDDLSGLELAEDYLQAGMQDGRATVYVEYDAIYKLVVERERKARPGVRAGFGAGID